MRINKALKDSFIYNKYYPKYCNVSVEHSNCNACIWLMGSNTDLPICSRVICIHSKALKGSDINGCKG